VARCAEQLLLLPLLQLQQHASLWLPTLLLLQLLLLLLLLLMMLLMLLLRQRARGARLMIYPQN
jgi:hypothetical protein